MDISTFIKFLKLMIRKWNQFLEWGSHLMLIVGAVVGGWVGRSSLTQYGLDLRCGNGLLPIAASRAELFFRTGLQNPGGTGTEG